MKKIYNFVQSIVKKHFYLNVCVLSFIIFASGGLIIDGKIREFYAIPFFTSVVGIIRLTTYKYGKIPIFMSDKTWNTMIIRYGEDKAEKLYKEMSLKQATGAYIVSTIGICISLIVELLLEFVFI